MQEDADAIGISILSGAHMTLVPRILELLRTEGADDVLVIVGGTIPGPDADALREQGVAAVFTPGTLDDGDRRLPADSTRRPADVDRRQHARPRRGRDRQPAGGAERALDRAPGGAAGRVPRPRRRRRVRRRGAHGRRRPRVHRGRRHRRAGDQDAARWRAGTPSTARISRTCSRRCASRRSRPSTATRSAAAARWRWPATCASPPTTARFGQPEINLGIIPGWGGTQRLARTTSIGFAKELVLTGRMVDADEALERGLVNAVFEPDELLAAHARDRPGDRGQEPDRARLRQGGDEPLAARRPRREPRARGRPVRDPVLDGRRARGPDGLHREARRALRRQLTRVSARCARGSRPASRPCAAVAHTVTRRPGTSAAAPALAVSRAIAASPASASISDCWTRCVRAVADDARGADAQERGLVAAGAPGQHARQAQLARGGRRGPRRGRQPASAREQLVGIDRRAAARQVLEAELRRLCGRVAREAAPSEPLRLLDAGAVAEAGQVRALAVAVPAEVQVDELVAGRRRQRDAPAAAAAARACARARPPRPPPACPALTPIAFPRWRVPTFGVP